MPEEVKGQDWREIAMASNRLEICQSGTSCFDSHLGDLCSDMLLAYTLLHGRFCKAVCLETMMDLIQHVRVKV